jgi:hypothetical protein
MKTIFTFFLLITAAVSSIAQTAVVTGLSTPDKFASHDGFLYVAQQSSSDPLLRYDVDNFSAGATYVGGSNSALLAFDHRNDFLYYTRTFANGLSEIRNINVTGTLPSFGASTGINDRPSPLNFKTLEAWDASPIYTTRIPQSNFDRIVVAGTSYNLGIQVQDTEVYRDMLYLISTTGDLYSSDLTAPSFALQLVVSNLEATAITYADERIFYSVSSGLGLFSYDLNTGTSNTIIANTPGNVTYREVEAIGQDIFLWSNGADSDKIFRFTEPSISLCESVDRYQITATTATTISVSWEPETDPNTTYLIGAVPVGFNGILTQVNTNVSDYTFDFLDPNTEYDLIVRKVCGPGDESPDAVLTTFAGVVPGVVYIDANATGNNDGSSWTDAYSDLSLALAGVTNGDELWMTGGTYSLDPTTSATNSRFTVTANDVSIYGGFTGGEVTRGARDSSLNVTIITGDRDGDDDFLDINTYSDNLKTVIFVNGENLLLDGLTITGGNAINDSVSTGIFENHGAAIAVDESIYDLTVQECIITENYVQQAGTIIVRSQGAANRIKTISIDRCLFKDNSGSYGTGLYLFTDANASDMTVNITNTVFDGNATLSVNTPSFTAAGSSFWIRAGGVNTTLTANITNCTFFENADFNVGNASYNELKAGTAGLSNEGGDLVANLSNCVFTGNISLDRGANGPVTVTDVGYGTLDGVFINNSISEENFSLIPISRRINTLQGEPTLDFSNTAAPYALISGSAAIDAGDNTRVSTSFDYLGNNRIENTTVDMGAVEFGATASLTTTDKVSFKIYPNPARNQISIEGNSAFAKAEFYNISGQLIFTSPTARTATDLLTTGIYLVKIWDVNGATATQKLVKI